MVTGEDLIAEQPTQAVFLPAANRSACCQEDMPARGPRESNAGINAEDPSNNFPAGGPGRYRLAPSRRDRGPRSTATSTTRYGNPALHTRLPDRQVIVWGLRP